MTTESKFPGADAALAAAAPQQGQLGAQTALHDFGGALSLLKGGKRVGRLGWNGKGMWLKLQRPEAGSKMTLPYIYMKTADNNLVPWLASQTDLLADDWVEVPRG